MATIESRLYNERDIKYETLDGTTENMITHIKNKLVDVSEEARPSLLLELKKMKLVLMLENTMKKDAENTIVTIEEKRRVDRILTKILERLVETCQELMEQFFELKSYIPEDIYIEKVNDIKEDYDLFITLLKK